jgi:NADPH-dependent glutamate synthase beta subunit-like oxidoreductase/NAD(P)H-flavin reductase
MNDKTATPSLSLGLTGFTFADLHQPERLLALLAAFEAELADTAPALHAAYQAYRRGQGAGMTEAETSALLLALAPPVGGFLARLFGIETECDGLRAQIRAEMESVFVYQERLVEPCRQELAKHPERVAAELAGVPTPLPAACLALAGALGFPGGADPERAVAAAAARLLAQASRLADPAATEGADRAAAQAEYAVVQAEVLALHQALGTLPPAVQAPFSAALALDPTADPAGIVAACLREIRRFTWAALTGHPAAAEATHGWTAFHAAARVDFDHLVHHALEEQAAGPAWVAEPHHLRRRDGFALTDTRANERQVLNEVHRCLYCHDRDADSCNKGMRNKKTGEFRTNPLGTPLAGCPLGERISEMHLLKRAGDNLAALALLMVDNPMCPGTGHRICNDCMKACIYQRFEPINIPSIETNILTDSLALPWGYEVYALLTRWNPLHPTRPVAQPYNGKNVLVVGLGPAGYTLAHYLLNEGFGVVGVDALKIEPLPDALIGHGGGTPAPIHTIADHWEPLDQRTPHGFGGVAEYGITVRWDKNFLKVIHITLARRRNFRAFANIRFGGTVTVDDAWELGFHHIALATGAGKPSIIGLKNNLLPGIRKASDFLMALQLSGAGKRTSLANLQVRLPAGVIGGGLTAVDAATEVLAYYPLQVEKVLDRHERLCARYGAAAVEARFDAEERGILAEFLEHGRACRAERQRAAAAAAGECPDFLPLLKGWGGVTLYYRKGMHDSPAYRDNHEELVKALEEGIALAEGMAPLEAVPDAHGALAAVRFEVATPVDGKWRASGKQAEVPLRTLMIAAGTSPNTLYEQEHTGTFELAGKYFRRHAVEQTAAGGLHLVPVDEAGGVKRARPGIFTSYVKDGRFISFYGDNHPVYAGNVVKAMASAKDGYPQVVALFADALVQLDPTRQVERDAGLAAFFAHLEAAMHAEVVEIQRLTPTIVEAVVKAPLQTRGFRPGQFYRVQNLEMHAPVVAETRLATEGVALTGAWVDPARGLLSLIALEVGGSSRLLSQWQKGDRVALMGPTGAPTEIPQGETVLLLGGGLGNAVLLSIGLALRAAGNRVLYVAGYRGSQDVFKREEIEAAADCVIWAVDRQPGNTLIPTHRPQDKQFLGNVVEALVAYGGGALGETPIPLAEIDRLLVIGSDGMMAAVNAARHGVLAPYLKPGHEAIGSINSPMQCMMKGICAQCLCRQVDPATGAESFVYTCFNQDQPLDRVDFPHLRGRLRQNTVLEKLAHQWVEHLLSP